MNNLFFAKLTEKDPILHLKISRIENRKSIDYLTTLITHTKFKDTLCIFLLMIVFKIISYLYENFPQIISKALTVQ